MARQSRAGASFWFDRCSTCSTPTSGNCDFVLCVAFVVRALRLLSVFSMCLSLQCSGAFSTRAASSIRVLVTFYFRLHISISGCGFFLQSVDALLEFMETWGLAISFANSAISPDGQEMHARAHTDLSVK